MSNPNTRGSRITLRPIAPSPKVGFPMPQAKLPASSNITLERWLDIWMEKDIEPSRADTTINGYDGIIRNHICPALGKVQLSDLTPELINGYYQWLAEAKALSANTIRKHHILLHTALKSAFRQGVIASNPVQRATPPRATTAEIPYYTPARLAQLLQAVKGDLLEVPVWLACFLGLRRSEILGLRWRDVDLHSGQLSVRWVRTTVGSRVVEKTPKTFESCRTLTISALGPGRLPPAGRHGPAAPPQSDVHRLRHLHPAERPAPHHLPRPAPHLRQHGQQRPGAHVPDQPGHGPQQPQHHPAHLHPPVRPDPRGGAGGGGGHHLPGGGFPPPRGITKEARTGRASLQTFISPSAQRLSRAASR